LGDLIKVQHLRAEVSRKIFTRIIAPYHVNTLYLNGYVDREYILKLSGLRDIL